MPKQHNGSQPPRVKMRLVFEVLVGQGVTGMFEEARNPDNDQPHRYVIGGGPGLRVKVRTSVKAQGSESIWSTFQILNAESTTAVAICDPSIAKTAEDVPVMVPLVEFAQLLADRQELMRMKEKHDAP